jgi:hypothetical protein
MRNDAASKKTDLNKCLGEINVDVHGVDMKLAPIVSSLPLSELSIACR